MNLTQKLHGKAVESVTTNGRLLVIRTADGNETTVAWVDGEGRPIDGKPVVSQTGYRLIARGLQDLMHLPRIRTHGQA